MVKPTPKKNVGNIKASKGKEAARLPGTEEETSVGKLAEEAEHAATSEEIVDPLAMVEEVVKRIPHI